MSHEYLLASPTAFMHLEPNEKSEVTDQLLYGTKITKAKQYENGFAYCKTEYGYHGYLHASSLKEYPLSGSCIYTVTSPFCGLYSHPEHRFSPQMILPRGSLIHAEKTRDIREFTCLVIDEKEYYVHKSHITPKSELCAFKDETGKRLQIIRNALSYLRTPYMWAGKTPYGIDCSGLCFMAYSMCGTGLYRDAEFDGRYLRKIPFCALKKADLIYYNGHVVMYLGNSYYIHASATLGEVAINSFDKNNSLYCSKFDTTEICCASSLAFSSD